MLYIIGVFLFARFSNRGSILKVFLDTISKPHESQRDTLLGAGHVSFKSDIDLGFSSSFFVRAAIFLTLSEIMVVSRDLVITKNCLHLMGPKRNIPKKIIE